MRQMMLSQDPAERKATPITTGVRVVRSYTISRWFNHRPRRAAQRLAGVRPTSATGA